jgi:phosphoenolpyruvate synthase/pyruvate phosphate dikinase
LTGNREPDATGRVAAPGVAVARVALAADEVDAIRAAGDPAILVTDVPDPADYPRMRELAGIVSRRGGETSHATVLALEAGIVAAVRVEPLELGGDGVRIGERAVGRGDWISVVAADEARVYAERIEEGPPELPAQLGEEMVSWARSLATGRS